METEEEILRLLLKIRFPGYVTLNLNSESSDQNYKGKLGVI